MQLNEVTEDQKMFESEIEIASANVYLRNEVGAIEDEKAESLDDEINVINDDAAEEKQVYRRSADDASLITEGWFLTLLLKMMTYVFFNK